MIRSMTGFGKAAGNFGGNIITIEAKSLNSKFLELNLRLPSAYKEKDMELRNEISKVIERGKVDFIITVESGNGSVKSAFNKQIIKRYYNDLKALKRELNLSGSDYLNVIMRLPEVMNTEKTDPNPGEWKLISSLSNKALKAFNDFRIKEGRSLQKDFEARQNAIKKLLKKIETAMPGRQRAIRNRLTRAMDDSDEIQSYDKSRLEQEMIYYIEKIDITEEIVRLKSHLTFFTDTLRESESNGKKLGFILQEIGREINTIGSKANNARIQRFVVMMKDELEKMKEQIANVL